MKINSNLKAQSLPQQTKTKQLGLKRLKECGALLSSDALFYLFVIVSLAAIGYKITEPARIKHKVSEATTLISHFEQGLIDYSAAHLTFDSVSTQALSDEEYISSSYGNGENQNPWNGDADTEVGDTAYEYNIILSDVPEAEGTQLVNLYGAKGTYSSASGTFTYKGRG